MGYRLGFYLLCCIAISTSAWAAPTIDEVDGALKDGESLTIQGTDFTEKEKTKPLLWWKADKGEQPTDLGRQSSWEFSPAVLDFDKSAPGSDWSARFDHGNSSGVALGRVLFDSDRIYLHRKAFDGFDITDPLHIRLKFREHSGDFSEGQTLVGAISGATGEISSIDYEKQRITFEPGKGNIYEDPATKFQEDETIKTSTGSAVNDFNGGDRRTFNYKTLRFWARDWGISKNNIWIGAQGRNGSGMRVDPEATDNTRWTGHFVNEYHQRPREWRQEEVVYQTSDIGKRNGIWKFVFNGTLIHDEPVQTRTNEHSQRYGQIFQSQVSNGAPEGSYVYYDSLYIDDSWHRVLLCGEPKWEDCTKVEPQIPTGWTNEEISVKVNKGIFNKDDDKNVYLYVFDKSNEVNSEGFAVCTVCPEKTTIEAE